MILSSKISLNSQILILRYSQLKGQNWAIPEIRGTPPKDKQFKLKIWEFPGSNFDLKKWEF